MFYFYNKGTLKTPFLCNMFPTHCSLELLKNSLWGKADQGVDKAILLKLVGLGNLLNSHSSPKLVSRRNCPAHSPDWRGGPRQYYCLCNPWVTASYRDFWTARSHPFKGDLGVNKNSIQKSWPNQTSVGESYIQKEIQRVPIGRWEELCQKNVSPVTKQKTSIRYTFNSSFQQIFIKRLWFRCQGYSMDKIQKHFASWILHSSGWGRW